jgi:uncharacterized protein YidB (DUF937 family)
MTGEQMKKAAEERRELLASRGINVKIRSVGRAQRTRLEDLQMKLQGWIGRSADLKISPEQLKEAIGQIERLQAEIEAEKALV